MALPLVQEGSWNRGKGGESHARLRGGQYGGCALIDTNGLLTYTHMDKFGRVDKVRSKKKEGE